MPLYTAITQEGSVSDETKAKIAQEITRIHTSLMKVPASYVRVVFLSYPKGSGYTAGAEAPRAAINCVRQRSTRSSTGRASGNACINDVIMHMVVPELPFGGVGDSGMGRYHGQWSFETFTHRKGFSPGRLISTSRSATGPIPTAISRS